MISEPNAFGLVLPLVVEEPNRDCLIMDDMKCVME